MPIAQMFRTRNVGRADRVLRVLPVLIIALAWHFGLIGGWMAIALAALAGMLLLTSILGSCSIYYMLGYSTCLISGAPRTKG